MQLWLTDLAVLVMRSGGRDDHAAAGHSSGDRDQGTSLGHEPGDARSSTAQRRLDHGMGSLRPARGVADRPAHPGNGANSGRCRPQRRPSPVDQPANRSVAKPQRRRHLFMAGAIQRRADQHPALKLRQRRHPRQRRFCPQPLLHHLLHIKRSRRVLHLPRHRPGRPQMTDSSVMRDAIKPSPDIPDLGASFQRPPRLQQRLLKRVLRARSLRHQPPAITKQLAAISTHQRLKRRLMTLTRKLRQASIRLGLKKPQ